MACFYDFFSNDVFVSLFLCSKWDDNTNFHSRYRFARNNNEVSFERKNENTTLQESLGTGTLISRMSDVVHLLPCRLAEQ